MIDHAYLLYNRYFRYICHMNAVKRGIYANTTDG